MQEVFEKIIGELNNYIKDNDATYNTNQNYNGAGAFLKAIDVVEQAAEEFATYTNVGSKGWISCSEQLPETNESVLCWAKSTARGGDVCFVGSCHNGFWFLQSSADTHSFPGQYVIVAWQPLPGPYTKGE